MHIIEYLDTRDFLPAHFREQSGPAVGQRRGDAVRGV